MTISGYADVLSVRPGGTLNLHVSTDAPQFRVELYRLGAALTGPLAGLPAPDVRAGQNVAAAACSADWGWPAYAYTIPAGWSSGVYVAMFVEVDANGVDVANQPLDRSTADGVDRKAMFVVRGAAGSTRPILFKLPTATYQAYNYTGGGSIYRDGDGDASLLRPGNGTGGLTTFARANTPYYQKDEYDDASDRMALVHLEAPFIRWLETNGYANAVDYCTDFDLHFDAALLSPYQLLLSVGHDEFWSDVMRSRVMAFAAGGGNVAFFSGNTCWKQITFTASWKFHNDAERVFNHLPLENPLTGVSYYYGIGRWDDFRQVIGYTLQHGDHWIVRGVGTAVLGDVYNHDPNQRAGLIGYECDGAPAILQNGVMVPKGPPTPADLLILGYAYCDGDWQDAPDHSDNPPFAGTRMCTMGVFARGGVTFTVGTVDWARVLASGREPRVEALTRNVLDTLSIRKPATWVASGGQLTSAPALAKNLDGRLELYARGYDGTARHLWQLAPSGGWSGWASEGGTLAGDGNTPTRLAIACNLDGRLSLFARFSDGSIRYLTQTAPNISWGPWVTLGGNVAGDPSIGVNADGRLEVFVRGGDGHLYHAWQGVPNGGFSGWADQGGSLVGNFAAARNSNGRLDVFARGTDNAIWRLAQTAPNNGWSAIQSLQGSFASDPAVGVNADGRLEVFVRGGDGHLHHAWQGVAGGGFSGWADRGGALVGNPAVATNANGRVEVFARGADHAVWHVAQTAPNNGWGAMASLGGVLAGDPAVGVNANGRLEVFAVSAHGTLWHRRQTAAGVW